MKDRYSIMQLQIRWRIGIALSREQSGRQIFILRAAQGSSRATLYQDVPTLYSSITTEKFRLIPPAIIWYQSISHRKGYLFVELFLCLKL